MNEQSYWIQQHLSKLSSQVNLVRLVTILNTALLIRVLIVLP